MTRKKLHRLFSSALNDPYLTLLRHDLELLYSMCIGRHILVLLYSYSINRSPSWDPDSSTANQEISHHLYGTCPSYAYKTTLTLIRSQRIIYVSIITVPDKS